MPSSDDSPTEPSAAAHLAGEQILFLGKLSGMTRQEACALVRAQGAEVSASEAAQVTLVVIGDSQPDLSSLLQTDKLAHQRLAAEVDAGRIQLVRESELWQRLGLVGEASSQVVQRLYTPAMLAELLNVPVAAIRRWHRGGHLLACRSVRRLPYFDFSEVAVARHLAALLSAGCSLSVIDRKLAELGRALPEVARPLNEPSIVVVDRQLIVRRGDDLSEPGGQLLIDFDQQSESSEEMLLSVDEVRLFADAESAAPGTAHAAAHATTLSTADRLLEDALEWEDQGAWQQAAEAYRTLLMAAGPTAEIHFALANLLYQMGDLPAARERFYAAIELDEQYVEARANLGCVLAESGELELAVAAFEGALIFHADYADVHYHLANALEQLNRHEEAELHWRTFLALAPESPWAELARTCLATSQEKSGSQETLGVVAAP
jgi:tetratricopeptide (TPR) repeat protein